MENPNLVSAEEREKIIKDLVANIGNLDRQLFLSAILVFFILLILDSETQKQLLKQLLENPDLMSHEEREKILKELVANMANLDR